MLIFASTTQKVICSFELFLFSSLLTLVYLLIVNSMRAFVHRCLLLLWSVEPFYFGMTRRNKLQYLIHIQDLVNEVVLHRWRMLMRILNCSILEYYHLYVKNVVRIALSLMNSWCSNTSCHHCSSLGFRVIVTGIPTSELWCVKSILLATLLLGS